MDNKLTGNVVLPKFDGYEIKPGIFLIGEPTAIPESANLRCLANINGALGLVEVSLKFVRVD